MSHLDTCCRCSSDFLDRIKKKLEPTKGLLVQR